MLVRSYTDARNNLKECLDTAEETRAPILIKRRSGGNAVLIAEAEWNSIEETLHLLGTRANAERLFRAIDQADAGEFVEFDLDLPRRDAAE